MQEEEKDRDNVIRTHWQIGKWKDTADRLGGGYRTDATWLGAKRENGLQFSVVRIKQSTKEVCRSEKKISLPPFILRADE